MTLDTKIALLKHKILHQGLRYNMEVLSLISNLKKEINRIDEKSFSFCVEPENNDITATRFVKYMDAYVEYMKTYFPNIPVFQSILNEALIGNEIEVSNLLDIKDGDNYHCNIKNKKDVKECIFKIIIGNFIKNTKYVPSIETFLTENEIKLKNLQNYNLKECEKIINLMSDIVFCLRGHCYIVYLFENIDINLQSHLEKKAKSKSKKYTLEDRKKIFINDKINEYDKIFKAYNIRKKYLRYFK